MMRDNHSHCGLVAKVDDVIPQILQTQFDNSDHLRRSLPILPEKRLRNIHCRDSFETLMEYSVCGFFPEYSVVVYINSACILNPQELIDLLREKASVYATRPK